MNTREWSDGIFTAILRRISASSAPSHRHWIVFDGDLDPDWVESLNSVLDDNKTLTLPNGERLELLPNIRVIFEVRDIGHGTPATVSRCGMVWFAENVVLVDDLLQRYIMRLQSMPLARVMSEFWDSPPAFSQPIRNRKRVKFSEFPREFRNRFGDFVARRGSHDTLNLTHPHFLFNLAPLPLHGCRRRLSPPRGGSSLCTSMP